MCKHELCRVEKVGRHTVKGKNGRNKVVRCCYASQAQGDRDEDVSKVSVAMVGETAESPPQSAETTQAAVLIWLAVEVKLNGTSRKWVAS